MHNAECRMIMGGCRFGVPPFFVLGKSAVIDNVGTCLGASLRYQILKFPLKLVDTNVAHSLL